MDKGEETDLHSEAAKDVTAIIKGEPDSHTSRRLSKSQPGKTFFLASGIVGLAQTKA